MKILSIAVLLGFISFTHGQAGTYDCATYGCYNGVSCGRIGEGYEYCTCASGFGGLSCELKKGICNVNTNCSGRGLCTQTGEIYTCACFPGYDGYDCEIENSTRQCAMPRDENDAMLFPACSLKTFLDHASACIDNQLPYLGETRDMFKCKSNVSRTVRCLSKVITRCSTLYCSGSIWELEIFNKFYAEVFTPNFYDYQSSFMKNLTEQLVCPQLGTVGNFVGPNITFDIGSPVCKESLIDNLLKILGQTAMKLYAAAPENSCSVLDWTRMAIFNETSMSCNFSNIVEALPKNSSGLAPRFADLLNKTQHYFLEWVIPECRALECNAIDCYNGGTCVRYPDGVEYCQCKEGYYGLDCSQRLGNCSDYPCGSNGHCYQLGELYTCLCNEGYDGEHCDRMNASRTCAEPQDGDDAKLFSACSLKTFLAEASECINVNLPYVDPMKPRSDCKTKMIKTIHCLTRVHARCTSLYCSGTIWELPVFSEFYWNTFIPNFYNLTSPFMNDLYEQVVCPQIDYNGTFTGPNITFDIGDPVCQKNLIDNFIGILHHASIKLRRMQDESQTCGILDWTRMAIFNETAMSCNFSNIVEALPKNSSALAPRFADLLNKTHYFFLEWVIPDCRDKCLKHNPCQNGAHCVGTTGEVFCVCQQRFTGVYCENYDSTAICPVPEENDSIFLPRCTIKGAATKITQCFDGIDQFITKRLSGQLDMYSCSMDVMQTMHCIGETLTNCSRMLCPSVYDIPGVDGVMTGIIRFMYNPTISNGISYLICSPQQSGNFSQMLQGYNLTMYLDQFSFCGQASGSNIFQAFVELERALSSVTNLDGVCSVMKTAQSKVAGILSGCNFDMIRYIPGISTEIANHLVTAANALRYQFTNARISFCTDDVDDGDCPDMSEYSSRCQMQEAYMCHYIKSRKDAIEWQQGFMTWWEGCSNFHERDWDDWASHMKMKRGDVMDHQQAYGSGRGKEGFVRMLKANFYCAEQPYIACRNGNRKYLQTPLGCTIAYCGSGYSSIGNLASMWASDHMNYKKLMSIYNALSKDCSRSSACDGYSGPDPTGPSMTTGMPGPTGTVWPTGPIWPTGTMWSTTTMWPTGSQPTTAYPMHSPTTDSSMTHPPMTGGPSPPDTTKPTMTGTPDTSPAAANVITKSMTDTPPAATESTATPGP